MQFVNKAADFIILICMCEAFYMHNLKDSSRARPSLARTFSKLFCLRKQGDICLEIHLTCHSSTSKKDHNNQMSRSKAKGISFKKTKNKTHTFLKCSINLLCASFLIAFFSCDLKIHLCVDKMAKLPPRTLVKNNKKKKHPCACG